MTSKHAEHFGVSDGDLVEIRVEGLRGGILNNVSIRTNDLFTLECHLDVEEANSMGITPKTKIKIVKSI